MEHDSVGGPKPGGWTRATSTVTGQPQTTYGYYDDGTLSSLTGGGLTVSMTYDTAGRPASTTLPNGVKQTYTLDGASHLTDIVYNTATGAQLGDLHYAYDPLGNRTAQWGSLARLTVPAAWTTATYNAANQLKTQGGKTYTYDANGSLIGDGTLTYTWNARNQLTGAAPKKGTASLFTYDAVGRRKSKTVAGVTTNYLYDADNLIQELVGTTPQVNYLTGPGANQAFSRTTNTATQSYLTDGLGSTLALANSDASLPTAYTYDPFGMATVTGAASTNTLQFTGAQNDGSATGLQYNNARYYNPSLGRFISQDPAGHAGSGINLYQYAEDNPVNLTDPSGLSTGLGGTLLDSFCATKALGGGKDAAGTLGCALGIGIMFLAPEAAIGSKALVADDGLSLSLRYKEGWSAAQQAAADSKVGALNDAARRGGLQVTQVQRAGTSAAARYRSAGRHIPSGSDVDHTLDLQLGGLDTLSNMTPLDLSVNRSLGAQISHQLKDVPLGTCVRAVTIC